MAQTVASLASTSASCRTVRAGSNGCKDVCSKSIEAPATVSCNSRWWMPSNTAMAGAAPASRIALQARRPDPRAGLNDRRR